MLLRSEAKNLLDSGFIGEEDFRQIKNQLPVAKTSGNILVRIGFFILGCFLYSSIIGATSILFLDSIDFYKMLFFFYAIIGVVAAEIMCKAGFHNYGLDDAFIIGFQIVFFVAIGMITESAYSVLMSMALVGLLACYRYFNTTSMLFSLIGISGFIAYFIVDAGIISKALLPFAMLVCAVAIFFLHVKLEKINDARLYQNSVDLMKYFSLLLGYLSVNYLVVRELSEVLMNIVVAPGSDIPFAAIFYILTFAIPVFYITFGIRQKDKSFLIIGLLALAFSAYTIRYYYSVMPIEVALILGGALLFSIVFYFKRRIVDNETGVTFKADKFSDQDSRAYLEALIVNSHTGIKVEQTESPMTFGGGEFSGGGSGGQY